MVLSIQPREAGGSGGKSPEEQAPSTAELLSISISNVIIISSIISTISTIRLLLLIICVIVVIIMIDEHSVLALPGHMFDVRESEPLLSY